VETYLEVESAHVEALLWVVAAHGLSHLEVRAMDGADGLLWDPPYRRRERRAKDRVIRHWQCRYWNQHRLPEVNFRLCGADLHSLVGANLDEVIRLALREVLSVDLGHPCGLQICFGYDYLVGMRTLISPADLEPNIRALGLYVEIPRQRSTFTE